MNILGVHLGHDSCAALIVDGKIIADVQEERFVRIKHYCGLPFKSVAKCLEISGLEMKDIDAISIASEAQLPDLNFLFEFPEGKEQKQSFQRRLLNKLRKSKKYVVPGIPIYIKRFKVSGHTKIYNVNHHLAHAASAYFTSNSKEKQLVITADGSGDGVSLGIWLGESGKIKKLKTWGQVASLGWFYSNVTEANGWIHGDGEGKTMGLAPYGDFTKCRGILEPYHPKFKEGELIEEHEFGQPYLFAEGGYLQFHFDEASDIQKLVNEFGKEDVSAEAQRVLEEQMFRIVFPWMATTETRNLSCAGGIFLNVKLNQRIWETGKVDRQYIFPNAGDSGLAVGAALYTCHQLDDATPFYELDSLYFGDEFSEEQIKEVLDLRKIQYTRVENPSTYAAAQLAKNKIVAWFQGKMESGPRALGNRSILMSANRVENKDIINARVKFREAFRPFCPSILWEKKEDYLEYCRDEFFMVTSFTCKPEKRDKVPAVVHADFTLRPQTVKRSFNEMYWELINEFGKLTGEYLVMNTSFNLMGEPIVSHPRDAVRCFFDNGIDTLVIGNFVLEK